MYPLALHEAKALELREIIARGHVVHAVRGGMPLDALAFRRMSKRVLEQGALPVVEAVEGSDRGGKCSQSLRPFRQVREQLLKRCTHHSELMKDEVGKIAAAVSFRERKGQIVRTWSALDSTRDREELENLVPRASMHQ